jgi:hypothetical protein
MKNKSLVCSLPKNPKHSPLGIPKLKDCTATLYFLTAPTASCAGGAAVVLVVAGRKHPHSRRAMRRKALVKHVNRFKPPALEFAGYILRSCWMRTTSPSAAPLSTRTRSARTSSSSSSSSSSSVLSLTLSPVPLLLPLLSTSGFSSPGAAPAAVAGSS